MIETFHSKQPDSKAESLDDILRDLCTKIITKKVHNKTSRRLILKNPEVFQAILDYAQEVSLKKETEEEVPDEISTNLRSKMMGILPKTAQFILPKITKAIHEDLIDISKLTKPNRTKTPKRKAFTFEESAKCYESLINKNEKTACAVHLFLSHFVTPQGEFKAPGRELPIHRALTQSLRMAGVANVSIPPIRKLLRAYVEQNPKAYAQQNLEFITHSTLYAKKNPEILARGDLTFIDDSIEDYQKCFQDLTKRDHIFDIVVGTFVESFVNSDGEFVIKVPLDRFEQKKLLSLLKEKDFPEEEIEDIQYNLICYAKTHALEINCKRSSMGFFK